MDTGIYFHNKQRLIGSEGFKLLLLFEAPGIFKLKKFHKRGPNLWLLMFLLSKLILTHVQNRMIVYISLIGDSTKS